jgi:hypothetical protein
MNTPMRMILAGVGSFFIARQLLPCSWTGHRSYYSPTLDETHCLKCGEIWIDSDISGRKGAHYIPGVGWQEDKD